MVTKESENKSLHVPSTARPLPFGWMWRRLDDVCAGIFDCPHSTPSLTQSGPLVARSQDIRTGVFRTKEAAHVSEETYIERIKRAEPSYGDLLYSREGTYFGIAAEVPAETKVCLGQRMVLLRPDPDRIQFRFLRYWLNSPILAAYVHGHKDGTVAERLNLPTIRGLPVPVPPFEEQQLIAHILGALDDKIELNRQINETLEALAKALFKAWFVDFDPVREHAEGRAPEGVDAETAALFADSFEDSELGYIPKGWSIGTLSELVNLITERVDSTPAKDEELYVALDDMPSNSIDLSQYRLGTEVNSSIIRFERGDILFGSMRPYFHKVGLAQFDGITRTTTFVLRPREDHLRFFALFNFASDQVIDFSTTASVGTTIPYIKWDALSQYQIVIPSVRVLQRFNTFISPLTDLIEINGKSNRTLTETHDALLPKLLSGEIRVKP